jgi:hypothetical protein
LINQADESDQSIKKQFDDFMQKWNELIQSPTEDDYNINLANLNKIYAKPYPQLINYIKDTWLIYKQKFIHA